jgi:hypothetical protein
MKLVTTAVYRFPSIKQREFVTLITNYELRIANPISYDRFLQRILDISANL